MEQKQLIGGEWVNSTSGDTLETINPSTGEVLALLSRGTEKEVDDAVQAAKDTFESAAWRDMAPVERGRILGRIAVMIQERKAELQRLECLDIGKPLSLAGGDVDVTARYFEYYAGVADKVLGTTVPLGKGYLNFTVREPWGVSAQIVPWNYPIAIGCRGIAPALAAGNTVVAKPSTEGALTLLKIGEIALEAGLPAGALNVITGRGSEAGSALASHPGINHCTFTGSVEVGIEIMRMTAQNIVPVNLELGGKSPNIVFADADLKRAIPAITRSALQNAGQTCSAGSRLLVEESVHDQVIEELVKRFGEIKVGAGIDDPGMGPLISDWQRTFVENYIGIGRDEGAELVVGGERPTNQEIPSGGFYLQPTILDGVAPTHRVFQEEIFGPVLVVSTFKGREEAEVLANATEFGLVTAIWTQDISKAHWLASRIRAGQVFVNTFVAGYGVEIPFGGYRKSGFGREKGMEAIAGYTQVKNVCIRF
ncbi:MAG: aldehyde dehydrogenase [SAR202 cluster bacterium Io17-Chloro-G3]|nr:MAG: aldehyde dehydrogenase [SAR202 cluster bacterium Io17-Chloro-G3]